MAHTVSDGDCDAADAADVDDTAAAGVFGVPEMPGAAAAAAAAGISARISCPARQHAAIIQPESLFQFMG